MWNINFLRRHARQLLCWPILALVAIIVLWVVTLRHLNQDQSEITVEAEQLATARTSAYAEQITRSFEQIDQATLLVRHQWMHDSGSVDVAQLYADGVFPKESFHVTIANQKGDVLASTLPTPDPVNFGDHDWFQAQKAGNVSGLLVDGTAISVRTGKPIVRVTRRLNHLDGTFAGVTWVTVEPEFLTSLYDGRELGKGEFISLRFQGGPLLAAKTGSGITLQALYRTDPQFTQHEGLRHEPGSLFVDGKDRIVAWKKLSPYPLVTMAALNKSEVYAGFSARAMETRRSALGTTILLLLLAGVGTYYTGTLALRKEQDNETRAIFRLAVDAGREGFYMVRPCLDPSGNIVDFEIADCNERGAELMGVPRTRLLGKRYRELYSLEYFLSTYAFFERGMAEGFFEDEMRVPNDRFYKAEWVQRRLVRSGSGLAMTIRDISDLKAHEAALTALANTDALTGLPNRHWLTQYLPSALDHARQYHTEMAVLFIDLDNFKNINDTLGHEAGDELLKATASRLSALVRASDKVVRLGGDEFTIVLEQVHQAGDVVHVAQAIVDALGQPFNLDNTSGNHVRASIGISLFPQDGTTGETLLKHADIAMYAAKAAGKGCYHFYQPHLSEHLLQRVRREEALREAILHDQFVLHYQPRVDTLTGRLRSLEALVRWIHPKDGLIPPSEFIPAAEETGLIIEIGEQIIAKACAQLAIWRAQGLPSLPISINVSALQFNQGKVKDVLVRCMQRYGIGPELIGIELTESCMVADNKDVPIQLNAIRNLGVKLLIDDFGTGYSSLSQLQELDVDILKIDRAFTRKLSESQEGQAFFKAIVSMAQALDIEIVAEGVETAEQLRILQSLSCGEVQGHYVSKPIPAEKVPALIRQRFLFPYLQVVS